VEGTIVAADQTTDLAIIQVAGTHQGIPCAIDNEGGPVAMIGYPHAFKRQELTHAEWRGLINNKGEDGEYVVISLYCEEIAQSIPSLFPGSAYELWHGLSGGPCLLITEASSNEFYYALGITISTAPEGVAGRVSCASISSLQQLCTRASLYLELVEPVHRGHQIQRPMLGEMVRGLADPILEQHAWNRISNLFFHESGVIRELENAVLAPSQYGIDVEDVPFVEYFVGRLLLKKGTPKLAERHLTAAVIGAQRIDTSARRRLQMLIAARRAAEQPLHGTWRGHLEGLKIVRTGLENLTDVADSYKYLELASLLGWQSMKLFLSAEKLPAEARAELGTLARDHTNLVKNLREARPNQEVVSTALEILSSLWSGASGLVADLEQITAKGFVQAKTRHNSIFFIQMIMTRALISWHRRNKSEAFALVLLVAELLRSLDLTVGHEGIAQLNAYMAAQNQQLEDAFLTCSRWHQDMNPHERLDSMVALGISRVVAEQVISIFSHWLQRARAHEHIYNADPDVFVV
jgi:hypothetical protein